MQNNYILKTNNNEILNFYYGKEKAIYCKRFNQNNYSTTIKIIQDVSDCFSISLGYDDYIYIACQQINGNVLLLKMNDNDINTTVLFNNEENLQNTLFYPIFYKNNLSLIFNSSFMPNQNGYLSVKSLLNNDSWGNTQNIDLLYPFTNSMFQVQKVNDNHIVLAYQKKGKDIQIGYKEIKDGVISDFITIHNTGYQIVDYSFVYYNDEIHYIYVLKNLFSSQVIYKKKGSNGFSAPIVLFEGQKIKSCNVSVLNGELFCSFIIGNILYYCKSENLGLSFQNLAKSRKNITQDVIKAKYISSQNTQGINEIYIDTKNELYIYLLPEFVQEFFSYNTSPLREPNIYNAPKTIQQTEQNFITNLNTQFEQPKQIEQPKHNIIIEPTQNHSIIPTEQDFMSNFNLEEFAGYTNNFKTTNNFKFPTQNIDKNLNEQLESPSVLKNKISMLNEQIEEKNSQILKLNSIIQTKNTEKTDVEIYLRNKLKSKEEEFKNIEKTLDKQTKENEELKQAIELIEEENINLKEKLNFEEKNISTEKPKQQKKDNKKNIDA